MKSHLWHLIRWIRRQIWAIIVAYMLGMHNFYKGDDKTPTNSIITIEHVEVEEDDTPKD